MGIQSIVSLGIILYTFESIPIVPRLIQLLVDVHEFQLARSYEQI